MQPIDALYLLMSIAGTVHKTSVTGPIVTASALIDDTDLKQKLVHVSTALATFAIA